MYITFCNKHTFTSDRKRNGTILVSSEFSNVICAYYTSYFQTTAQENRSCDFSPKSETCQASETTTTKRATLILADAILNIPNEVCMKSRRFMFMRRAVLQETFSSSTIHFFVFLSNPDETNTKVMFAYAYF
jgi:hypothetical protein